MKGQAPGRAGGVGGCVLQPLGSLLSGCSLGLPLSTRRGPRHDCGASDWPIQIGLTPAAGAADAASEMGCIEGVQSGTYGVSGGGAQPPQQGGQEPGGEPV